MIKRNLPASRRRQAHPARYGYFHRHRYRRFLPGRPGGYRIPEVAPVQRQEKRIPPDIYFAGNSISGTALRRAADAVRGPPCVGQRHFQIRHHHRGRPSPSAYSVSIWSARWGREEAKKRIYATTDRAKGHPEGLGRPGGIRDLCRTRQCGRTLFRLDCRGPAAHRGGGL